MRQEYGVTGAAVYHDTSDPAFLIVTHEFNDRNTAEAFANSDKLKEAMADPGVASRPDFWFGEALERTDF